MFLSLLLLDYANFCLTQYNTGGQQVPFGGYASPAPAAQPGSVPAPGPSYASAYGKVYRITYTNYNRPPPEDRIFDGSASCCSANLSPKTPSCCPNARTSGGYNTPNKPLAVNGGVPSPSSYYNKPAPAPYYSGYGNSPGGTGGCCSPVGPPTLPHPGTPDTSDPCFSKYSDCLIVNVQPYERRPRFTVDQCKSLCQSSRLSNPQSPYACRSFVYNNNKQLCDLFGHTGTQPPSRLGKMPGWDYYVFNANNPQCQNGWTTSSGATTTWPIGPTPFPDSAACPAGQTLWWYSTTGYAFRGTPILQVSPSTMDQCQTMCTANRAPDNALAVCKSFNFDSSSSSCEIFGHSTNNKVNLVKNAPASYYQKICMDSSLITNCPKRLDRYPQKVLVGLAEVVTDSSSFDDCVTKCLRSVQLYNIQCVSGEIFYDENTQNCILNVMSRKSRPDLFIDAQPVDNVDYFETGCITGMATRQASQKLRTKTKKISREEFLIQNPDDNPITTKKPSKRKNRLVSRPAALIRKVATTTTTTPSIPKPIVDDDNSANGVDVEDEKGVVDNNDAGRQSLSLSDDVRRKDAGDNEWTEWSDCDRSSDGRRVRYRRCSSDFVDRTCPLESEDCDKIDGKTVPRKKADQGNDFHYVIYDSTLNRNGRFPPKNFPCPENRCCKVFNDCRVGVKRSKDGSAWAWCPDPCPL